MLNRLCQVVDLRQQLRFTMVHSLQKTIAADKSYFELLNIIRSQSVARFELLRRSRLNIDRAVSGCGFVWGTLLSIHVNSKRLARSFTTGWRLKSLKAMPGMLVRLEKNAVIEKRRIGHYLVV